MLSQKENSDKGRWPMLYKYETHLHTSEGSGCSNSTAAETVRKHKEEGYTGVFITDHYFNGNSSISRDLPWDERIDRYCMGYEHALEEGKKVGLDVFFGFEYGNGQADFLTYGLDGEWLRKHPEILEMSLPEYFDLVHADGGMVIHAHPFRQEAYIHTFTLAPEYVDGVEIINASNRLPEFNERAKIYAEWYDLPVTAGSDTHNTTNRYFGGGIVTDTKITCPQDYIRIVKERKIVRLLDRFGSI